MSSKYMKTEQQETKAEEMENIAETREVEQAEAQEEKVESPRFCCGSCS